MTSDCLSVALVGCGRISARHAELLGGDQIAGAKLAAVCDIDAHRALTLGQKYAVPHFTNMHEMMQSSNFDLVAILTESGFHAQHAIELAPYGSNILVEKPMALLVSDADRMIEACEKAGVRLFVVKQNRFNLPVQKLREAVDEDRFGKLILGTVRVRWCRPQAYYDQASWRGTWRLDGGVLTNQASHHVDLLEWMMGDVESVFGKATTALAEIEAEDTAVVTLKFANGALGLIEATTATRPRDLEGSLSLLGEKGSVEIGGFAVNQLKHWSFTEERPDDKNVIEKFSVNPPDVYGYGHRSYYEHVVSCLRHGAGQLVDGLQGRRSLELISAIYESIETGREVNMRFSSKHVKLGK
ncbi:MAG: Gfo/Idh/MocA family protein [Cellvibrionaceae bacterium]